MNLTIWKYPLAVADMQTIAMPAGAEPLFVAVQGANVCLWARVNPDAPNKDRAVRVAGTGHPDATGWPHAGSFLLHGGALVFHVFVEPEVA